MRRWQQVLCPGKGGTSAFERERITGLCGREQSERADQPGGNAEKGNAGEEDDGVSG